ncbi:sodium:solute symporter family protein [Endozoicomonadaceae bacterium StTr2]
MSNLAWFVLLAFLVVTLGIGFKYCLHIRNLRDYALSPGFFGTAGLCLSLVATEIGSGSILGTLEKVHQDSMIYAYGLLGLSYQLILTSLLAPRIFRKGRIISVGDLIADAYGETARTCTALFWLLFCIGIIAAQTAAMGRLASLILPTPTTFNMIAGAMIIMAYSSYCGIRAVVATDTLQAFLIVAGLLLLLGVGLESLGGYQQLMSTIPTEKVIGFGELGIAGAVSLFLSFAIGDMLIPPVIQRVTMAKNSEQASGALVLAGLLVIPIIITCGMLGLIAHGIAPNLVSGDSFQFMLNTLLSDFTKSLVICGILAAVMSSADSYLNTAGVALSHDLLRPLFSKPLPEQRYLALARGCTLVIGSLALLLSLTGEDVMDLILYAFRFWGPTVAIPFLFSLFVRNTTPRQFFLPALAGLITVTLWEVMSLEQSLGLNSLIAGMAGNAIVATALLCLRQGTLNVKIS